jgi:hypothetical protein
LRTYLKHLFVNTFRLIGFYLASWVVVFLIATLVIRPSSGFENSMRDTHVANILTKMIVPYSAVVSGYYTARYARSVHSLTYLLANPFLLISIALVWGHLTEPAGTWAGVLAVSIVAGFSMVVGILTYREKPKQQMTACALETRYSSADFNEFDSLLARQRQVSPEIALFGRTTAFLTAALAPLTAFTLFLSLALGSSR